MNDNEVSGDVKVLIITQERMGVVQQIYRMGISIKARNIAGYTEQETAPLTAELERLIRLVDALDAELATMGVPGE